MRAVPRSIARVLDAALAADPDREALVTRSRRLSYGELDGLADRAAHALADLGERLGERVLPRNAMGKIVRAALHDALLGAP